MWSADRILVPVDFSPCSRAALAQAVGLAQRMTCAHVDVLHAWQAPLTPDAIDGLWVPPLVEFARTEAGRSMRGLLEEVELLRGDVSVSGRLCLGDAVTKILEIAADEGYDLIVMGRHGKRRHLIMGGVTERVVRRASCPVMIIHGPGEAAATSHGVTGNGRAREATHP